MRPKTMQVPARKCLTAVLLVSCWTLTAGQVTSTTKAPTVTTTAAGDPNATVYPKERGLIFTTYDDYSSDFAHLRHLPMMPGYQNWSGGVPGVAFTNIYIKFLSIDVDFHEKMIAVDWLSHTVYWTDSIYRWICAAAGQMEKINDDIYTILVDQGLEAPAGIALHPMEGIMFWSDSGKHPKIERGDMTGKNRHTIVSNNLLAPKTLEVDTVARRLFWIDRDKSTIESVTFDGTDRQTLRRIPHTHICLADIRVSANAYYDSPCVFTVIRSIPSNQTTTPSSRRRRQVTDGTNVTSPAPTQKTSPPTVNTTTQAPPTTTTPAPTAAPGDFIQHVEVDSIGRAFYYSDASNRIYKRPVDLNINDTAKELVTYAVGEVTEDGGTETVRETNDMPANLMVLPHESGSSIKKMAMDGTGTIMTLNSEAANPKALSVDYDKKLIYWVNEDDELYEMKTDGSLAHRVKQLSTNTFAIAVHKINLRRYSIRPFQLQLLEAITRKATLISMRTLKWRLRTDLLDPFHERQVYKEMCMYNRLQIDGRRNRVHIRWLFFTADDYYFGESYIGRSNMDGTQYKALITTENGEHVVAPDGLCIDYIHEQFFWSDRVTNIIQSCNFEGTVCETKVNLTGQHAEIPSAGCKARNGLGDCSTICVPTSGTKGRVCMCEEGEYLNDDERTCSNVYQCNEFIMQDDGVEVTFDYDTCLRHFGDECDIICPINYVPTSTAISKQKCLNSGWANETAVLCEVPQCPMTLMNGLAQIAANCDVSAGKLCKYTCADGYTLNSKLPSLTCGVNGQWVVKSDQPCIYEVICRKDLTWHPQNACQEAKCDMSFGSVTIQKDCDLKINSKCGYSCSSSFEKHSNVTMLTCRADGTWNQTNVCLEASNVAVTDAQTGSGGAISQAGATAGIVILVVIIVALVLVIAFVFFRKRKSSEVPYSTASFHNKGDVAIENPGYQATPSATPTPDRRDLIASPIRLAVVVPKTMGSLTRCTIITNQEANNWRKQRRSISPWMVTTAFLPKTLGSRNSRSRIS
ncbi:LRP5-like protein [Mya arenaria]|uniref:LRP5-like protein n=1 Tax=Mya arenaria TaxID=6604 RepID=A0ABY7ESW6_MYAAR|nr:LRP5-like protein [Mya arenaria]